MKQQILASGTLIMTLWSVLSASSVNAASPEGQGDVFSRNTPGPSNPSRPPISVGIQHNVVRPVPWVGPRPQVSRSSTPVQWFEATDEYVGYFRPSSADAAIIGQSFNQEVERVELFCRTVVKISRNYRILAKRLQSMPIPATLPEAQTYRDLCANWYSDQASLYEDLVRPRKPARTKEELAGIMGELDDRSQSLASGFTNLQQMDQDIRKKHGVHGARYEDALHDYATRDQPAYVKKQLDQCQQ